MTQLFVAEALLESGWHRDVLIEIEGRTIKSVVPGAVAPSGAVRIEGAAVPGVANVHSHAFQRAMAGLAEQRGPDDDDFWTWREVMYRFLARLTPGDVEAIAAMAYVEMLEVGLHGHRRVPLPAQRAGWCALRRSRRDGRAYRGGGRG